MHAQEKAIVRAVIKGLLDAGYLVSVFDGEETTVRKSTDAKEILNAMGTTDEDYLFAFKYGARRFVYFVYGNEPYEVICDYSTSLENVLAEANALADKYENGAE